jgi:RNA polymerase sigma factor (sigma-70 family)
MERESGRLQRFIRRRVDDVADAEDILQEVFSELVESTRMLQPIEQVGAWLFRVARYRIIDRFRKWRQTVSTSDPVGTDEGLPLLFEEVLPAHEGGRKRPMRVRYWLMNWRLPSKNCRPSSGSCSRRTKSRGAASRSLRQRPVSA